MKNRAVAEAPGRLDFLGGVADYSGSLVLQTPIQATTRATVTEIPGDCIETRSVGYEPCSVPVADFLALPSPDQARQYLAEQGAPTWSGYPLGCLWYFCRAKDWSPRAGLRIELRSKTPESQGVSSSAALEVAVLRALGKLARVAWSGTELARLGQAAENHIVGAPCGLMDQLAADHGRPGALLPILCRPDELREPVQLPEGVVVVGWPSGVKHAVSGSPYLVARTATFMGKRIFETKLKRRWVHAAEIRPSLFHRTAASRIPGEMLGREFLAKYRQVDDPLSNVEPRRCYRPLSALRFPVEENQRAALAEALLRVSDARALEDRLREVGELMLLSHAGYSALGLGTPETDRMVDALIDLGPEQGVYGARTSGGGSGGTVVVLLKRSAVAKMKKLARSAEFRETSAALIR